jgi:hypothetical protein
VRKEKEKEGREREKSKRKMEREKEGRRYSLVLFSFPCTWASTMCNWEYSYTFTLPDDLIAHSVLALVCEGLDTIATLVEKEEKEGGEGGEQKGEREESKRERGKEALTFFFPM